MNEERYPRAKREHPSTYFVQDRSNEEELRRLHLQDAMLTTSMGGVLPEQPDPASFHRVLDVGCGTGGWLIEVAQAYPTIQTVMGIDVSARMVAFAREQAHAAGVGDRVTFHGGDVLRRIDVLDGYFDLVNHRLGMSYLRLWDWSNLLQEYQRVTRSGGIIRITEANILIETTSPAFTRIGTIVLEANRHAGHLFTAEPDSVLTELPSLMERHGIQDIQTKEHRLLYRAGTPEGQQFAQDMTALFHVGLPFLQKWTRVPDDYDAFRHQAIMDMQQPGFEATWAFLTAWGRVALR
jgi:ubiquinone/menaquinone biosynthesis C-methylase UbiE